MEPKRRYAQPEHMRHWSAAENRFYRLAGRTRSLKEEGYNIVSDTSAGVYCLAWYSKNISKNHAAFSLKLPTTPSTLLK